ncbi:zinc ribbon domain-containing protein [Aquibacillus kalidii]|uniref:zinc ribbon domain-containing protein n=1 Tax=Aquibacillus kalidii TaxID=2762597 RepID=UPI001C996D2D|nr:zinc ribbon domain-containing protein [Aquibacillus kalidii]
MPQKNLHSKWWILPIACFFILLVAVGSFYIYLEKKENQAEIYFNQGEELALNGDFYKAQNKFEQAIKLKDNFPVAKDVFQFMQVAIDIDNNLTQAEKHVENNDFTKAIKLINQSEDHLKNYNGEVVNLIVTNVATAREKTLISQLDEQLAKEPSISELKNLLWDAESIQNEKAKKIATDIREQIIAFTFSEANQSLKENQFTNARDTVEEGLKYAPNSEKLLSMKTTIEKEKTAFETALEQRIEQAMNAAEEERNMNENDAVEIVDIKVSQNDQKKLVVSGKLKSVATVPINSISVEYQLLNEKDEKLASNEVYIYPDTLYPDEEGRFEYTHFDIKPDNVNVKVKIVKVKWFLD